MHGIKGGMIMKRILILMSAAVAAFFAASCAVEIVDLNEDVTTQVEMKEVTITASIEPETKTTYDTDGKFSWTAGDEISVFCSDKKFYTFKTTETGATVTFKGFLPEGITPRNDYAFFPANAGHRRAGDDYFFHLADVKDLSVSGSADLPMGAIMSEGVYEFKHMTGAALFTFTNVPDGIDKVEVAFSSSVRLSGEWGTYTKTVDGIKFWSISAYNATEGTTEGTFIRTVKVVDNTAKVYLPYPVGGTLWSGLNVSVKMTTPAGKTVELLNTKTKKGIAITERACVIPCSPVALPDYLPAADWNASNVAVYANDSSTTDGAIMKEIRAFADEDNLYVRVTAASSLNGANYLDVSFCDGEGENAVWWGWTTTGTKPYWEEHKGTVDASGNLTSMQYSHSGSYKSISTFTEISENGINWYLIYPREYVDVYKNSKGTAFVSCLLWKDYAGYWAAPARDNSMLEVTLP